MNSLDSEAHCSPELMRKSVENLVLTSHDVIGQSISQALAFSGAMTPSVAPPPSSPLTEHRRTPSPNLSPRHSPPVRIRRYNSRSHTHHLSVPLKDTAMSIPQTQSQNCSSGSSGSAADRSDFRATEQMDQQDNTSRSSDSSQLADLSRSISHDSERERETGSRSSKRDSRVSDRSKKKSSWLNALYPTYKSRSEDFKKIFKDVPDDERLVVDYSCAMQKDILVQGRLYVSQNFLCFYANIFRWETVLSLKWKEVTSITKEKTALVIPNAILVCTETDKHFFTSFTARDKAYLMLFRVWQNALMNEPMSMQEMWQWVHTCYGDELGLTSDDEDYVQPKILVSRLSVESFSEECLSISDAVPLDGMPDASLDDLVCEVPDHLSKLISTRSPSPPEHLPTDMSDTTESDADKNTAYLPKPVICPTPHSGRQLVRVELPIHVDALFKLLFTGCRFFMDFHTTRNTQDLMLGDWVQDPVTGLKTRTVSLTVALTQPMGPKSSQVTESQVMLPCSVPGQLYSIDIDSVNSGIPYAESFVVFVHYCIMRSGETQSCLSVHAQIKYKKSVWGVVKGFIEKNCWAGLEDFFDALIKMLSLECEELTTGRQRKPRRRRRIGTTTAVRPVDDVCRLSRTTSATAFQPGSSRRIPNAARPLVLLTRRGDMLAWGVLLILVMLLFLNIMLYYKLWSLEERSPLNFAEIQVLKRNPPQSHDEWLRVLQRQESLHSVEMRKWQRVLHSAIQLLRKTEQSLGELQFYMHSTTAVPGETAATTATRTIVNPLDSDL